MDEQTIDVSFDDDVRVRAAQIANVVVTLAERVSEQTDTPACGVFQEIIKLCVGSMFINDHGPCAEALLHGILAVSDLPDDASIN
jgi:hypothetical protein